MIQLPVGVDINNLIDDLRNFSREASEILISFSENLKNNTDYKKEVIEKTNMNSPVTEADLRVSDLIITRIKEKYPLIDWELLSEENYKNNQNCFKNKQWLWVLDPLDGTKDFIQGTGDYAMHLALNYMNKPYLGVVLIPSKNQLWISDGNKVWCERNGKPNLNLNLSKIKNLDEMALVSSRNHNNKNLKILLEKIKFKKKVVMGSIGCKIASIIKGESDIYLSYSPHGGNGPKDWDFAAPEAILRAAGGLITNIDNEDLTYGINKLTHNGLIIASSDKENHGEICKKIKDIIKENNLNI